MLIATRGRYNPDPVSEPYVSIVVPCYNEQESVRELHRRVSLVCGGLRDAAGAPASYEIVLINDGSRDATWPAMASLADADPNVVAVNLSRNHGHQLALTAGLSVCRGRHVLILDADLQDPPELLPAMLARMDAGVDVVFGQRRERPGETLFKRASAAFFYRLIDRMTETPIPKDTGDFRLVSRRALDVFIAMPERHRFIRGMIAWVGFRQEPIAYDRDRRFAGTTKYPFRKMLRFALDAITAFSVRPLQLASLLGLATGAVAVLLLVFVLVSWLFFNAVHGWASQLAIVTILGSVQLFVLGIIGEYLGRLYEQSKGRPLFIVESIRRHGDAPDVAPPAFATAAA